MGFRLRRSARLGPLRFHFTASGLSSISLGGPGASLNLPVKRRGGIRASAGIPGTGLSWSVEQPGPQIPSRGGITEPGRRPPLAPAPAATALDDNVPPTSAADQGNPAFQASGDGALTWARAGENAPRRAAAGTDAAASTAAEAGRERQGSPASTALPNSRRLRPSQLQALRQHCLQLIEQQLFRAGSEPRRLWEEALVSRLLCDPAISGRRAALLALVETRQALTAYLERSRSQDDLKRRCQRCLHATETALRLCGQRGWLA